MTGPNLITFGGADVATDLSFRAASCALMLREILRDAPMALTVLRSEVSGAQPVGDAVDRAARDLLLTTIEPPSETTARIAVDRVTAALLAARFEIAQTAAGTCSEGSASTTCPDVVCSAATRRSWVARGSCGRSSAGSPGAWPRRPRA